MHLFTIGNTKIKCGIVLLAVIPVAIIFGKSDILFTAFISLTLHELSHTLIAGAVGYKVLSVELQPFGFVANLSGNSLLPECELAIAAGGPVCSLISATGALAAVSAFPDFGPALHFFAQFNLMLAVLNLLPALPLDGGRMLRALLSKRLRPRTATLIGIWSGIVISALMVAAAIGLLIKNTVNITLFIIGFFLLAAAVKEYRNIDGMQLSALMARSDSLRRGERLKLCHTAMHFGVTAAEALKTTHAGRFNVILVVDDTMRKLGELDEGKLIEGIARYGSGITIGRLVRLIDRLDN
ncbi:MAG: putative zinc metalloprotease Rip3 [Firmicutes bacterium ADurb.Bin182]|nr:MAG: putative zinc metalloprotease Rip3 [Firmicutes bacterium ADurb.Bin182]